MEKTRELKEKWTEINVKIQHKTGGINYNPEYMFISNMLITAIENNKPLSDNEIETIECFIRVKQFENGLL